jgi:membrane associated rhomboid family serine protease
MIPIKDDNYLKTFPYVTVALIAINAAIFLIQILTGEFGKTLTLEFSVTPYNLFHPESGQVYITLFTSMFLHAGIMHLAGNMIFLWIFGDDIEDALGHVRYLVFYIICGLAAISLHSIIYHNSQTMVLGASGAISGILGAYFLLYPEVRVLTVVPIFFIIRFIWIPSTFFLIIWFVFQLLYAANPQAHQIAFLAHIGGFLAGLGIIHLFFPHNEVKRDFDIIMPWQHHE